MYVGFFASNLVLGGQSLSTMSSHISTNEGIVIVGVVSVTATIFGYDLIHAYTRVTTPRSGRATPRSAGSARAGTGRVGRGRRVTAGHAAAHVRARTVSRLGRGRPTGLLRR
jgi:hypothetical protein